MMLNFAESRFICCNPYRLHNLLGKSNAVLRDDVRHAGNLSAKEAFNR